MKDENIIKEARKRWEYCGEVESANNALWVEDLKFANGNSDNGYQWDEQDFRQRTTIGGKPSVTINKIKQHNLQITNEARKGRQSPKVVPVDSGSDVETAEIINGIIKHIEDQSCAESAYSTAIEFQVDAGLGYWRIITDYADETSFDQEIYIDRVKNPLSIRIDPDIKKSDGSDMRYAFISDELDIEYSDEKYGADCGEWSDDLGMVADKDKKTKRFCEYYRITESADTLISHEDGTTVLLSASKNKNIDGLQTRKVISKKIEWFLLTDKKIVERKVWIGKYIPIVRVVGLETIIDGRIVRTGHTRAMKDAQRIYNLWSSSAVEFVKLQGKQPYLAAIDAIEGLEEYWDNINKSDTPYLPFNHLDENGNQIPVPRRQEPPVMAQAYIEGMQISSNDMQSVSGQYDGAFGKNVNQQSGVALRTVERQGENSTFHFVNNADMAKRFTAVILLDLIPKIYDTERVIQIIGEDGRQKSINIDPNQDKTVIERKDIMGAIQKIYNPNVGRYDVVSTTGASYETKRIEAADAMIAMSQANPAIWQTHGDLIVKAQDWPMADEFAKRFEKIMPPGLMDKEEGQENNQQINQIQQQAEQQIQQMQQQIQQLDGVIQEMTKELESKEHEREIAIEKIKIEKYNAETKRKQVLPDPEHLEHRDEIDQQMKIIALRKAEAEARLTEINAGLATKDVAREVVLPQLEENKEYIIELANIMKAIQLSIEKVGEMAEIASRPRQSVLQFDEQGMPISSISHPIQ